MQARDQVLQRTVRSERYQRALLDNFPFLVWLKDTESRFLTVNRNMSNAVGETSPDQLIGKTDHDYFPRELADRYRADDAETMSARQGKQVVEPIVIGGRPVWHETYKAPVVGDDGKLLGSVGFAIDISEKKRATEAMLLRNAALAGLIRGEALNGVLELLCLSIEAEMPEWHCSIMLIDETGTHLHVGAAPRLPETYSRAVDGIAIGESVGSCGAAAALRNVVIAENVFTHPNWVPYHDLARAGGFAACWSEPIIGPEGQLLGTLAAYHPQPSTPSAEDLNHLTQAGQLAALLLAHEQAAQDQQRSRDTFRGIFDGVSEAIFIQTPEGQFLDVNHSAEKLFGLSREVIIGLNHAELGAKGLNDLDRTASHIAEAFAGQPQVFEFWAKHADGTAFPVEVRLTLGQYFGRSVLIASVTDITEHKVTESRREIERDLAQQLAANAERPEILAAILQATLRFPEIDAGSIYCREADGSYRLFDHHGYSAAFVDATRSFPAESDFARRFASERLICSCAAHNETCTDARLIETAPIADEGLSCLAILPIKANGRPYACLFLAGHQTRNLSAATRLALNNLVGTFSQTLERLEDQEEARRQQENLRGLFDTLKDFIFIIDHDGRIIHHNRAVGEGLGYGEKALLGQPVSAVHPEKDREMAQQLIAEMLAGKRSDCPLPLLRANGQALTVDTRFTSGTWNGTPVLIGIAHDITDRLLAEERQKLAASVFDNAHEGIMITDPQGRIVEVNATFTELTGYPREEAVGQTADLLKSGHHDANFYLDMWRTIRQDGFWRGEVWNRKKGGEIFAELLTISTVRDRSGEISHFVGIFSDITLLKQHQQRLEHLAHFDALTQLPNRMLLSDRMQLAMAQTARSNQSLAVCYLDLDGFKPVNDQYGHSVGDRLLVEVAHRLKTCVRAGDTVARLGGDEFVLLFSNLDDEHECDRAIGRVIASLTQNFHIAGHDISISASIGVTLYPQDGADADTLLRHADQAMYMAKQAGRNRYHLFDPEHDRRARLRREEIKRIREGLKQGEFELHYQPKVNMRLGRVIGAEALIRWHHPEHGLLLPDAFLPSIEGSELAAELGDWVICEALRQMTEWAALRLDISVSINIAGDHLQHQGFVGRLGELLVSHPNVNPNRLELEVLETAALDDLNQVATLFAECRRLGVSFALDDFGTGYSSLTYFRRLPAELLKIDQSFVRDMLDDPEDLAIVEGVIGLTQAFKRQVIAEGVESVEHGLVLLLLGCDLAQGYGIARPMPARNLPGWIAQFRPDDLWSSATSFSWSRDDLPMLIAEVEHGRWKKALYSYLDDPGYNISAPASDPQQCRFGRWYYSPESQRYARFEAFGALESAHNHVHLVGQKLIDSRHSANPAALDLLKRELEEASNDLLFLIQQIQAEVLLTRQSGNR